MKDLLSPKFTEMMACGNLSHSKTIHIRIRQKSTPVFHPEAMNAPLQTKTSKRWHYGTLSLLPHIQTVDSLATSLRKAPSKGRIWKGWEMSGVGCVL